MKKYLLIVLSTTLLACSTTSSLRYPPVRWMTDTDQVPHQKPKIDKKYERTHTSEGSSIQIQQMIQLNDQIEELSYNTKIADHTEALNTNNFDEVPDSTWFTNRIGRGIINFPKITDENKTGAEIIATRILHMAGYNVPYSQTLDGEPLSPFSFNGRRHSDKNDRILHEHRRELRGYKTFCAWLGILDASEETTYDMFVPVEGNKGFVMHYFVDLSSALNNQSKKEKSYINIMPFAQTTSDIYWSPIRNPKKQLEKSTHKKFDPKKWKPVYTNTAFLFTTKHDEFWAAKIIMQFSDEILEKIVDEANFSDPSVRQDTVNFLIDRRNKITQYWLTKLNPLDNFQVNESKNKTTITFNDLAVNANTASAEGRKYRYLVRTVNGRTKLMTWANTEKTSVTIPEEIVDKMKPNETYVLQLQTKSPANKFPSLSLDVFIKKDEGTFKIMGLNRRHMH